MPPVFMGSLFGAMGLFVLWTLVRAVRTGRIYSEGRTYDADGQSGLYGMTVVGHVVILILCVGEVGHALGLCPSPFATIKSWLGPLG